MVGSRLAWRVLAQALVCTVVSISSVTSAAAADGIFLSFSPTARVQSPPQGQIQPGEAFEFYVLGSFGASVAAWEAGVSVPPNISVINRSLGLNGSFNVSDATVDDWVVGIEGCLAAPDVPVVLVTYTAELVDDVGQVDITLTESRVATAGAGKTVWVTCDELNPLANDCDAAGSEITVNPMIISTPPVQPNVTRLVGGIPNPFNPSTTLRFELATAGDAELRIYDTAGKLVREFLRAGLAPGSHEQSWDGTDDSGQRVASGAYFVRLRSGRQTDSLRIMLLK